MGSIVKFLMAVVYYEIKSIVTHFGDASFCLYENFIECFLFVFSQHKFFSEFRQGFNLAENLKGG